MQEMEANQVPKKAKLMLQIAGHELVLLSL